MAASQHSCVLGFLLGYEKVIKRLELPFTKSSELLFSPPPNKNSNFIKVAKPYLLFSVPCIYFSIVAVLNWTQNNYVEGCKAEWLLQRCKFNPEMKREDTFQSLPVGMFQYQIHHRRPGTLNIYWVYYTFLLHKNGTVLHLQTSCFHESYLLECSINIQFELWWPKWMY